MECLTYSSDHAVFSAQNRQGQGACQCRSELKMVTIQFQDVTSNAFRPHLKDKDFFSSNFLKSGSVSVKQLRRSKSSHHVFRELQS